MVRSQRGAMSTWLKIVLICVVVVIVGTIALGAFLFNMGSQFMKTAGDPNAGSKTLREIVQVQEPLPEGWKYAFNMNMGDAMKMVSLANKPTDTFVSIIEVPNSKHQSADDILANPSEAKGLEARGFTMESRGEESFAGQSMKYIRGSVSRSGRSSQMEMGVITRPNGKLVMVQTIQPGKDFDPEVTKPLFKQITGLAQ